MNRMFPLWLAAGACVALAAPHARAGESYDNCTGFIDSVPAVISTQGVWCLRKDLATAIESGDAIGVAGNNITIDCNGFKLGGLAAGVDSGASGIRADERTNVTVRNCAIRGFLRGVFLQGANGSGHLVEDNRFDGNLYAGIEVVGSQNRVQRNRVHDTSSQGTLPIAAGIVASGDVLDNTVDMVASSSAAYGILIDGDGLVARGNQVRGIYGPAVTVGVNVIGGRVSVVDNQVINVPSAPGRGVWGTGNTFCARNLVAGFTGGALDSCVDAGGNATD